VISTLKAKIDRQKIDQLLEGRSIKWLCNQLVKMDIDMNYRALISILNGYSECKITYALGIAKVFEVKVEELFCLH